MYLNWLKRYNFLIFDEIDSTNSEAKRLASSDIDGDFVIWADNQNAGRGRYGRVWESKDGNLFMSILLRSDSFKSVQSELSFVTALSVYDAINQLGQNLNMVIKWPNDILINDAKVSGILLESLNYRNKQYLVIGIGVNIKEAPNISDRIITSLESNKIKTTKVIMLNLIMEYFVYYYNLWLEDGFFKIRELWLSKSINIGSSITVSDGRNRISGLFSSIAMDGSIVLKLSSGDSYTLSTGEVFFGEKE